MLKHISLIAPVTPFRGGIARHSEAIARELDSRADVAVHIESFARLFPSLLYPGTSDRDPDLGEEAVPFLVNHSLDTLNPLTWREVAARSADRGGLAIIPAWTFFVAPALGAIARMLRKRGVQVIMIVHNVADHERSAWKSHVSSWQLSAASAFITHTEQLATQLRDAGHMQPVRVVPHPPYADFPKAQGTLPRERSLELLCFGLVRHYKGIDLALRALAASKLHDVRLTIAGEIWDGENEIKALIESLALKDKVELIDRYVSDQETAELFARCDAVLAPYRSVTGSGVLALAENYRRPVVASDLPGLAEIVRRKGNGWLFPSEDEFALAALLRESVTRSSAAAITAELPSHRGNDGWDDYAAELLDLAEI